ncbi:MAG: transcriptional regulator [bacterium]|nr:transcriptional regulator [bacterium]
MKSKPDELVNFLRRNGGIARFSEILEAGFHPDSLQVLEKENRVEKISWGLYKLSDYEFGEHSDIVIASLQAPRGVICLLSALSFHEATIEIPKHVDMAIPQGSHTYKIKYPPVKFYRFSTKTWEAGFEEHIIDSNKINIYNLAKTVADCFKFRNKIGINIARESLKVSIIDKKIKPLEIIKYAKLCRVDNIIKPILETII